MNILQLEYFLEIAEKKSFSQVAADNYVSQPSVSMQISTLEKDLKVRLFNRGYRSVSLTPAGLLLYKTLKRHAAEFEESVETARHTENSERIPIHIALPEYCDLGDLPELLCDFQKSHPNVALIVESCAESRINLSSPGGRYDIIINQSFMLDNTEELNVFPFASPHLALLLSRDRFRSAGLSDLKDMDLTVYIPDLNGEQRLVDHCRYVCSSMGLSIKEIVPLANVNSVLISAKMGLGVGLLDEMVLLPPRSSLYMIPSEITTDLVIAYRKDNVKEYLNELSVLLSLKTKFHPGALLFSDDNG